MAKFLEELHKIDVTEAPKAGIHNFYRGDHPSVYDAEARESIVKLEDIIDNEMATAVWEKAIQSRWDAQPVWIHGDFSSGNFLVTHEKVAAIIDFGCMGIGDPACDLVIAWTFFSGESRNAFQSSLILDPDTWARARGWALWKACLELLKLKDTNNPEAIRQQKIIDDVIKEHSQVKGSSVYLNPFAK